MWRRAMATSSRPLWGATNPTLSACTTQRATSLSGLRTAGGRIMTKHRPTVPRGQMATAPGGSTEAARGLPPRLECAQRIEGGTRSEVRVVDLGFRIARELERADRVRERTARAWALRSWRIAASHGARFDSFPRDGGGTEARLTVLLIAESVSDCERRSPEQCSANQPVRSERQVSSRSPP